MRVGGLGGIHREKADENNKCQKIGEGRIDGESTDKGENTIRHDTYTYIVHPLSQNPRAGLRREVRNNRISSRLGACAHLCEHLDAVFFALLFFVDQGLFDPAHHIDVL